MDPSAPPGSGRPLPAAGPGATTRLLALLGDPVEHSLSPRMQNAGIRALGLDGVYVALRTAGSDLAGLLRGIARSGGGGNVTLPHKEAAARVVEDSTEAVVRTGACNTFWMEDGVLRGDNTDVAGVRAAVATLLGGAATGARILLLGAGGAARGVALGLLMDDPEVVAVRNRTPGRAEELVRLLDVPRVVASPPGSSREPRWDLVVNATRLGLHPGDPLPIEPRGESMAAVLDVVYGAAPTPLVQRARERGLPAADGREMLLQQGMASFRRWWGVPAPEAPMRAALEDS